jgi:RNA polymerase I-specific transcription initiation factor RRN3
VTQYNELVSQFSAVAPMATSTSTSSEQKPTSSSQLRHWLSALSHVVSQLDKRYITLVEAIVYTPWTTFSDENLVKIYINFIGVLVSARTEYLSLVAGSTINRLTHRKCSHVCIVSQLNAVLCPGSSFNAPAPSSPGSLKPLTLRVVFERTQLLLRTLLSLFPTLPSVLRPHLLRYFPHKRNSVAAHSVYVRNLLDLTMWCPQVTLTDLSVVLF